MRAGKLLGSSESWRKQARSPTPRQPAWAPCHAPAISLTTSLVARPAEPAQATRAISGTECSVHWVLLGKSGLLSTSVPLHLQTTIGHHEAPQRPQNYPKGIVGNLVLRNTWGFSQTRGHRDEHTGRRASTSQLDSNQVKIICICQNLTKCLGGLHPLSLTCRAPSRTPRGSGLSQESGGFSTSKYQSVSI